MKLPIFLSATFCLLFLSCENPDKEKQLDERENALLVRESEFATKLQEYETLKQLRDSLNTLPKMDTLIITSQIPEYVSGKWNGKMICTESDCSEHVIGDQRNDIWFFSDQNVKIINKTGGERNYTARMEGKELKLAADHNSGNPNNSEIVLQLPDESSERIKGVRTFSGNNCTSKFSIDLEKIKN